jgi:hypothetical protein
MLGLLELAVTYSALSEDHDGGSGSATHHSTHLMVYSRGMMEKELPDVKDWVKRGDRVSQLRG